MERAKIDLFRYVDCIQLLSVFGPTLESVSVVCWAVQIISCHILSLGSHQMLSSLKKKILGTPTTPKATPVPAIATAVASPVSLLARETSGRNIRKIVDTNTVYNQFEQLKRFQHSNSPSDVSYQEKLDKPLFTPEKAQKKSAPRAKLPVALLLVAIVSAITASVIVLLYTHLYPNGSGPVLSSAVKSPHYAASGYELYQPPHQVEQYLQLPQLPPPPPQVDSVAVPTSASIYKVIRIRKNDLSGQSHEEQPIESSTYRGRKRPKFSALSSLKKVWNVVSSIVMVPGELKEEKDFHFY